MSDGFPRHVEPHGGKGSRLRDFILGWQDGLVNVLGVVLGVATATENFGFIIIAAMAAAFAESISMAAVAYTSFKAEREFYLSEVAREKREIRDVPDIERSEVRDIYYKLGFRGSLLAGIVRHITSNKKRWLNVMVEQELKLSQPKVSPANVAVVVGISAMIGSVIPIAPFLLFSVHTAIIATLVFSTAVLFCVGIYKGYITGNNPLRSGIELAIIGMLAALAGYAIGALTGAIVLG